MTTLKQRLIKINDELMNADNDRVAYNIIANTATELGITTDHVQYLLSDAATINVTDDYIEGQYRWLKNSLAE